ncbi:MAG TPA: hypothetical protein DDX98_08470 [Bacteroidales bacterium]|nr:hypothetical protein [Bacteroidales bacterium]
MIAIALAITVSCSKDDDSGSDKYPGVPTGVIVPIEERAFVLTGMDDSGMKSTEFTAEDMKFWKFEKSEVKVSGCGMSETYDNLDYFEPTDVVELAFTPSGELWQRFNGNVSNTYATWEWSDASKSGIYISSLGNIEFEFTELNENQVVYASKQTGAFEECSSVTAITYEVLSR